MPQCDTATADKRTTAADKKFRRIYGAPPGLISPTQRDAWFINREHFVAGWLEALAAEPGDSDEPDS